MGGELGTSHASGPVPKKVKEGMRASVAELVGREERGDGNTESTG